MPTGCMLRMGLLQGDNKMACLDLRSNEMDDWTLRDDQWDALDQKVEKCANGRQHAVTKRDDRGDTGFAGQPGGQNPLESAGSQVFVADVGGQGNDAEAVLRGLLEGDDVIAGQPGGERHD